MVLPCWPGAMLGLIWLTGVTWLFSASDESLATNIFPVVITGRLLSQSCLVKYFQMLRNHSLAGRVGLAVTDNKLGDSWDLQAAPQCHVLSMSEGWPEKYIVLACYLCLVRIIIECITHAGAWQEYGRRIICIFWQVWNLSYEAKLAKLTDKILHGLPCNIFARSESELCLSPPVSPCHLNYQRKSGSWKILVEVEGYQLALWKKQI